MDYLTCIGAGKVKYKLLKMAKLEFSPLASAYIFLPLYQEGVTLCPCMSCIALYTEAFICHFETDHLGWEVLTKHTLVM